MTPSPGQPNSATSPRGTNPRVSVAWAPNFCSLTDQPDETPSQGSNTKMETSGTMIVAGMTTLIAVSLLFLSMFVSERGGPPKRRRGSKPSDDQDS
jgi:hypothetical protein